MRRRSSVSIDVKHDRWLVSYSDFVTLLFAFFVVMYSISQVNEGKYKVLSDTLIEAFSVPESAINPIQIGEPTRSVSPNAIELSEPTEQEDTEEIRVPMNTDWMEIEEQISEQFTDLIDDNLLTVNSNELWLELELNSNILFPTASADPSLQAKGIFEEIASLFSPYANPVQVEGFTDNIPISNRRFSSNWELSAARAASVVKLLAANGVEPGRLSAVGRGEFQPIADNNTSEGRAKNRRVVVMLSKQGSSRPQINSEEIDTVIREVSESPDQENDLFTTDQLETAVSTEEENTAITPLELNNGGLLFTSDPDLPRNNVTILPRDTEQADSETP